MGVSRGTVCCNIQLTYVYLHDSLPQAVGTPEFAGVFCMFQNIRRLMKLHNSFPKCTRGLICMYWCIYKLYPSFLLLAVVFIIFGEASPQYVYLTRAPVR